MEEQSRAQSLKYAMIVFAAGACYGAQASVIKTLYAAGFTFGEGAFSQVFFGMLLLAVVNIVARLLGQKFSPMTLKAVFKLIAVGLVTGSTSIFYYKSLTYMPASVGIVLLFQFTWMGVVIQVVTTRKRPPASMLIAVGVIVLGTLFASGVLGNPAQFATIPPIGIAFGLASAVCCALFMHFTGTVETHLPATQRTLFIAIGATIVASFVSPGYFSSGVLQEGIWRFGIILGFLGLVGPIILFAIGTPHLPTGISTIMASSELPISVFLSVTILGEKVEVLQVIGVAVILLGVVVSQLGKRE